MTRDPSLLDPALTINGHQLYRIDGVWCARTQGGTWRPAVWLGHVTTHELLDRIHELETQCTPSSEPSSSSSP